MLVSGYLDMFLEVKRIHYRNLSKSTGWNFKHGQISDFFFKSILLQVVTLSEQGFPNPGYKGFQTLQEAYDYEPRKEAAR